MVIAPSHAGTASQIPDGRRPRIRRRSLYRRIRVSRREREKTSMNDSQIFCHVVQPKTGLRDGLYLLAEYFPHFLKEAPSVAVDVVLKIAAGWVEAEHPTTDQPVPLRLDDIETSLVPDYSSIWGRARVHHDEPSRCCDPSRPTSRRSPTKRRFARSWRRSQPRGRRTPLARSLSAGTQKPTTVGRAIRSLAWDRSILTDGYNATCGVSPVLPGA